MNNLLWKFYLNDSSHLNYLFGTMHIGRYDALKIAQSVTPYLDKCAVYAGETDMEALASPDIIRHFKLDDGIKLSDLYPERKFMKMKKTSLKYFEIGLDSFSDFTPFFILNLITQKLLAEDKVESVDRFLWNHAMQNAKILIGVESIDEQINYFYRIPLEYQTKSLAKTLKNVTAFKRNIKKINQSYIKQDLTSLYKKTRRNLGSIRQMMLNERNQNMSIKITDLATCQSSFIAVGAAHLPGKTGLIRLLKNQGFSVMPVQLY